MTNPFGSALGWIEGTVLGTVATVVAVIAVAAVGFMMLSGRIDVRRSTQVILGCFIIFGASTIAGGVQATVFGSNSERAEPSELPPPPPQVIPQTSGQTPASTYDPYAGAAVPQR